MLHVAPCCLSSSAPTIASATPTSPTTAVVTINPPLATIVPVASYSVIVVEIGSSTHLAFTCTDPTSCPLTGLTPSVTYTVTATATLSDGSSTPPSSWVTLAMPSLHAATLTSAVATGPTTGTATATSPSTGGPVARYTFTAKRFGGSGNSNVICTSASPRCSFTALTPGTQYSVSVTVTDGSGNVSPPSNHLILTTAAAR